MKKGVLTTDDDAADTPEKPRKKRQKRDEDFVCKKLFFYLLQFSFYFTKLLLVYSCLSLTQPFVNIK